MHGDAASTTALLRELRSGLDVGGAIDVAVFPPFVYLPLVRQLLEESGDGALAMGAQNLSAFECGAYTGEVAAEMLADCGCRYVLVGHSERRALFAETDARVAAKFQRAQSAGLIPVLCIGEDLAQREADITLDVVRRQLQAVIDAAGVQALERAVLAYEPVWAIGTGHTASPGQAQEVHEALRATVARQAPEVAQGLRILYGGSVNAGNAEQLFAQKDIDGGLVGGASLQAQEFIDIVRAANAGV